MTRKSRNIRNPEKWLGRYVRHMANWWDFAWAESGYVVCEWTGRLLKEGDTVGWYGYFETQEQAETAGYNECYYYCHDALMQMVRAA